MSKLVSVKSRPFIVDRCEEHIAEGLRSTLKGASEFPVLWSAYDVRGRTWHLAKGHPNAPSQVVVWYPNGEMWSSYASTLEKALDGAASDAYLHI
jgi:hypothetical protein